MHDSEKDLICQFRRWLQRPARRGLDLLLVPGGTVNADTLRQDSEVRRLVREFSDAVQTVAAICHGPWLLIDAGVARGKTLTSYSSVRIDLTNAGAGLGRHAGETARLERLDPDHPAQPG